MRTATRAGGVAAVAVATVAVVGAALASPSFVLTGDALSDLGQPGNPAATPLTTLLFNGGLVLAALVGLPFAAVLRRPRRHPLARVAAVPFAVALVGMAGVGLFPAGRTPHVPAALALYLGSMAAMTLDGLGSALTGATTGAAVTLALVAVHVTGWWWWAAGGAVVRPGLAMPELLGAAVVCVWVCVTTCRPAPVSNAATGPNS